MKFLATSFSTREAEPVSDTYYPPRLTDNSVFIYQSNHLGNLQRLLRSGDYFWVAFFLAGTSYPVFSAAIFGVFYAGFLGVINYHDVRDSPTTYNRDWSWGQIFYPILMLLPSKKLVPLEEFRLKLSNWMILSMCPMNKLRNQV